MTSKMSFGSPFVRSPYNYDTDAVSRETALVCDDPSLTKQSFAEECDINTIVRQFGLTGKMPDDIVPPTYADFEGIFDFHSAMNAVAAAGEEFDRLPAKIRARFHNDPGLFVDFCSDPNNLREMVDMGLAVKNPSYVDPNAPLPVEPVKGAVGVAEPAKPLDGAT